MKIEEYKQAMQALREATKRVTALHEQAEDDFTDKAKHNIGEVALRQGNGNMFVLGQIQPCFSQFGHAVTLFFVAVDIATMKKTKEQRDAFKAYQNGDINLSTFLAQTDVAPSESENTAKTEPEDAICNPFGFGVALRIDGETFEEMMSAKAIDFVAKSGNLEIVSRKN